MKREEERGYVPAGPGRAARYPVWVKASVVLAWVIAGLWVAHTFIPNTITVTECHTDPSGYEWCSGVERTAP